MNNEVACQVGVFSHRLVLILGAAVLLPQQASCEDDAAVFQAGAATSNITLPLGAMNGGVISRGGPARQIHDELHARCIALDDGHTRRQTGNRSDPV